ncbi:Uncharacterized protein C20orf24 [Trichoplax sp. H2]|nr:Uncharacterized protein C20orf24 [Trichoplax sp. H2]|eukprot:RDD44174.1 Uncharacterized protein C20orf24 [Trichoplax sp. H2]
MSTTPSKRQKNKGENNQSDTSASVFHRALRPKSTFEKDEYLDIIYWLRQIVGLVFGVVWGIIPLYGILGIGIFGIANAGLLYLYFTYYQPADEEEVGDTWELTKALCHHSQFFLSLGL